MFIGDLFPHDDETLVNHKVIPPGFGKFKIKTAFAGRHDAVHLSSKQKKRRDCGLNYSPRKVPRKFRKELRNPCPMV